MEPFKVSFGLISGFAVPIAYALGTAIEAIMSRQFHNDLLSFKIPRYRSISSRLIHQISLCLFIQYSTRVFILRQTILFTQIFKDGLLIFLNTHLFYFLMFIVIEIISWVWKNARIKLLNDNEEGYRNEFDNCWRLHSKDVFTVAEFIESMHSLLGFLTAFLFIYYCGDTSSLFKDIYKWVNVSSKDNFFCNGLHSVMLILPGIKRFQNFQCS